jgi:hypothetical protein
MEKFFTPCALLTLIPSLSFGAVTIANFNTLAGTGEACYLTNSTASPEYSVSPLTDNGLVGYLSSIDKNLPKPYLYVRSTGTESATASYLNDYLSFTISSITTPIQLGEMSFELATRGLLEASLGLWVNVDGAGFQQVSFSSLTPPTSLPSDPSTTSVDLSSGKFIASSGGTETPLGTVIADLSGLSPASSTIEFRIGFGDNANDRYVGMLINDIQVTQIPEPTTYALGATGLLGALVLIRRRLK